MAASKIAVYFSFIRARVATSSAACVRRTLARYYLAAGLSRASKDYSVGLAVCGQGVIKHFVFVRL